MPLFDRRQMQPGHRVGTSPLVNVTGPKVCVDADFKVIAPGHGY